ncbi:MAG: Hsp20/alpha crystallin family protein [Anaerococcus sp.]|nr:Hsp20/alpha crystallin family protein [Anaerococcus sp.]MDD7043990.1 Hsp20/alpha crystallin family protein [Peptoniphilaceae bacterium]MDY2919642.1 Hsp20/alpha crystallin family protein [Anaerococcus sp.]
MTNLLRRNNEIDRFNDFYNMVDTFFNDVGNLNSFSDTFKVDISEDEDKYLVEAELAGFDKEDIDIDLDKGKLTLTAKKVTSKDESDEEKNYIHRERKSQAMSRTMNFVDIDEEKVGAKLENGILVITLPKSKNDPNRKITID